MVGFRQGDVFVTIGEQRFILRLTLGALAEIDMRLGVNGPLELATKLKEFSADMQSVEDAFCLLECLLRPALPTGFEPLSFLARQADPQIFMSAITHLFEVSFKSEVDNNG